MGVTEGESVIGQTIAHYPIEEKIGESGSGLAGLPDGMRIALIKQQGEQ